MGCSDTQRAVQDALNLIEKLRRSCTDLAGWGHLYRAQRYLVHPEVYELEVPWTQSHWPGIRVKLIPLSQ